MNRYINRLRIVLLPLIVSTLLSGCTTTNQPQNTNAGAQSNKNTNTNASSAATKSNATGAPEGWMDGIQGEPKAGASITIVGWAADVEDAGPAKRVDVLLDNNVVAQATLGKLRDDVAKATGRLAWERAGWEAIVSLANVSPGEHKISAIAYDSAGNKAALYGARDINVAK